jgi:type I restriction enzyme M protein
MGSQGDAGQFRTPRHIIDFVTACVDPQKGETVLDPACGTAGFLLSAYKHILNNNTDKRPGDKLKPEERKKLSENIIGYDISPDMVRLSLANMYLHGFSTPEIHEYDTLSSEDRWNETYDVILANPPFMTPKGGIKPHKKFGVQANKAEVLFTDYIAEHLNPNGRAGIVVPNGIVATSQTAYKLLRKVLVEDSLIAVISLPAGCFNPYSGVKTSVLILDKALAKKTDKILFLKIENDGYDLGAQRREIDKNDLPLALLTLNNYKKSLSEGTAIKELPTLATLVEKQVILEQKDVVFSAERYFNLKPVESQFPIVKLGSICEFKRGPFGGSLKKEIFVSDGYLVYEQHHAINGDFDFGRYFIDENKFNEMCGFEVLPNDILVSCSGTMGKISIVPKLARKGIINQALLKLRPDSSIINTFYLKRILETDYIQEKYFRNQEGAAIQNVASVKDLKEIEIPLPPLDIQQQIVAEIEAYQKIIDGARQVVENYKPVIKIKPEWEMVELGEVCKKYGKNIDPQSYIGNVTYIGLENIGQGSGCITGEIKSHYNEIKSTKLVFKEGMVLYGKLRPNLNKVWLADREGICSTDFFALEFKDNIAVSEFYFKYLLSDRFNSEAIKGIQGASLPRISYEYFSSIKVPLPPISEQNSIMKSLEEELYLVNQNKRLIEIYEQRIKDKISEVWGVDKSEIKNNLQVASN